MNCFFFCFTSPSIQIMLSFFLFSIGLGSNYIHHHRVIIHISHLFLLFKVLFKSDFDASESNIRVKILIKAVLCRGLWPDFICLLMQRVLGFKTNYTQAKKCIIEKNWLYFYHSFAETETVYYCFFLNWWSRLRLKLLVQLAVFSLRIRLIQKLSH